MQPVNDDMDNLFRRAAEGYPLNTSGANFDKVRQVADTETPVPPKKEPKRRYLWLLLLLLPLPFVLKDDQAGPVTPYSKNTKNYPATQPENQNTLSTATPFDTSRNNAGKDVSQTNESKKRKPLSNIPNRIVTQHPETTEVKITPGKQAMADQINKSERQQITKAESRHRTSSTHRTSTVVSRKNKKRQPDNESVFLSANSKIPINKHAPLSGIKEKDEANKTGINANLVRPTGIDSNRTMTDSALQTHVSKDVADSSTKDVTNSLTLSRANKNTDSANTIAKNGAAVKNKNRRHPAVYIGVVTGPDYSTAKSNKVDGAGYNAGFIAGYHTGRHLAFETGLIWNYKKYYSDGKHVTVDKLELPMHSQVLYLDGRCGMFEIPLNVRYHFNTKAKQHFYAGAGISSYIMKKEIYDSEYNRYNVTYYQHKEFINATTNWMSVLQLTIGYQVNFKKAGSLRIEPYAKLPLHGIGIGKLPLSGAGINVGFTLPVHQFSN